MNKAQQELALILGTWAEKMDAFSGLSLKDQQEILASLLETSFNPALDASLNTRQKAIGLLLKTLEDNNVSLPAIDFGQDFFNALTWLKTSAEDGAEVEVRFTCEYLFCLLPYFPRLQGWQGALIDCYFLPQLTALLPSKTKLMRHTLSAYLGALIRQLPANLRQEIIEEAFVYLDKKPYSFKGILMLLFFLHLHESDFKPEYEAKFRQLIKQDLSFGLTLPAEYGLYLTILEANSSYQDYAVKQIFSHEVKLQYA